MLEEVGGESLSSHIIFTACCQRGQAESMIEALQVFLHSKEY